MGLITIDNIEDATLASANVFNQRFGKIVDVINGNIESANLKNSAVTREKIATGAVTSDKIATNRYIDENGWTVNDLGTTKTYTYIHEVTGSENDNNGSIGLLIQGNGSRRTLVSLQPPVGRTVANIYITATYSGVYSGHLVVNGGEYPASTLDISGGNIWNNPLSFKGRVVIQATEAL